MNVCLPVCMYISAPGACCAVRGQRGHHIPMELVLYLVLSYHVVLGRELGPLEEQQVLLATLYLQDALSHLSIPGSMLPLSVLSICHSA